MILLFCVAGFDFGYVSPGGIVPFFIAGGPGYSEVGFIVPCPP
jgi:hypothetical protein